MSDDVMNDASSATFLFEVDGVDMGSFQEVSGLEVSIDTEDVQEGGQNSFTHKLPGRMSWPNITLKRGVTKQDSLLKWLNEASGETFAVNGNKLVRKSAAITLVDRTGKRLRAWNFIDAYPVKWSGPSFAASSTDAANEELEITHHGFRAQDA
jgi:phage tail-like protein